MKTASLCEASPEGCASSSRKPSLTYQKLAQELHGSDAPQGGLNASTPPLSDWEVPEDRQNLTPLSLQPGTPKRRKAKPEGGRRAEVIKEKRQEAMNR